MVSCRRCGCNCDPGDLKGGICEDCREEERQEEVRAQTVGNLVNGNFYQMKFEFSDRGLYANAER